VICYPTLRFRQKFVFFNHGSDGEFAVIAAVFHAHNAAFALHANAFGERDFGRKSQRESNERSLLHSGIKIKADAAGADIANLGNLVLIAVLTVVNSDRDTEREAAGSAPLVLGLYHASSLKWLEVAETYKKDAVYAPQGQYHGWVSR
jgi:hypothetical protein